MHTICNIWTKNDHHTPFWEFIPQNMWYLGWVYVKIVNFDVTWRHYWRHYLYFFLNIYKICNIWTKNDHHTSFWELVPKNMWYLGWVYTKIVNLSILTSYLISGISLCHNTPFFNFDDIWRHYWGHFYIFLLKISIKSLIFHLKTTTVPYFAKFFMTILDIWVILCRNSQSINLMSLLTFCLFL